MTEEERVEQINKNATIYIKGWLNDLYHGVVKEEDILSSLYAAMVTAYLYGYSPDKMAVEAKAAAVRLLAMVEQADEEDAPEEVEPKE